MYKIHHFSWTKDGRVRKIETLCERRLRIPPWSKCRRGEKLPIAIGVQHLHEICLCFEWLNHIFGAVLTVTKPLCHRDLQQEHATYRTAHPVQR